MAKFKIYWTASGVLTLEAASAEEAEKWMYDTPLAEIRALSGGAELEVEVDEVDEDDEKTGFEWQAELRELLGKEAKE